jgi:hypothetical protein
MTVLVRWFYVTLPYPFAVSCPNTKINLKSFAAFLVDRPRFLRALTACSNNPDVYCSYMTSSCKYALFSFLNRTEKNHTAKQLTNEFLIDSGASWHSEPTCPTLSVPTCLVATFLCFRLYHPQTKWKSTILSSFNVSQKEVPFIGGTMSHVAVTKLQTQNIL